MGRITENDAVQLSQINNRYRSEILYKYLVEGKKQKVVAEEVYQDYGDWASMRVSVVTRGFGFHDGRGRGKYRSLPQSLIRDFVRDCVPEDFDGGLDEGTFDHYISDYLRHQAAMQQEAQRRQQEEAARQEAYRQHQLEAQRRQQEVLAQQERLEQQRAAEQERLRQQREAERKAREEQERQERLRREAEEQAKEAARKAAVARGEHTILMNKGFAALDQEDYELAQAKAEEAWALQPMIGLQYIFAFCAAARGNRSDALKWAAAALESYEEGSEKYLDLCVLYLDNGGSNRTLHYAHKLYDAGALSRLNNQGIAYLGKRVYSTIIRMEGGLRIAHSERTRDEDYMNFVETLSLLIVQRIPAEDAHRHLMLNCAFVLTRRGHYQQAIDIYNCYKDGDCFTLDSPAYDLRAHLGYCYHKLGDNSSALLIWYPELLYHPHYDTQPMDIFWAYNYDEVLRELTHNNPEVDEHMEFMQQYADGKIPGSVYYARYFGNWRSRLGLEADADTRWYCDDDDTWHVEVFTQRPSASLLEQARGFIGKLFGR